MGLGVSVACAVGALVAAAGVVAMALPGRPACRDGFDEATRDGLSHHRASPALALTAALPVIGVGYASELRARKTALTS
ncbi:hypothetical protein ABTX60_20930 [Streptomyces sp. NPDC126510]|uniref:hypothetical protein n=1 Tax=Streptomyces sp. NPDC126510 TaxID=3155317 RepID=UPI00331662EA